MNQEQADAVKVILAAIKATQAQYQDDMARLRSELLSNVVHFDTYGEMYEFIKQNTPSLEAFNRDMLDASAIFWRKRG